MLTHWIVAIEACRSAASDSIARLVEGGFAAFTFEGVAERARTSRPVLARRWATREELMLAAIRYQHRKHPVPVPVEVLTEIVDTIVLPLLTGKAAPS